MQEWTSETYPTPVKPGLLDRPLMAAANLDWEKTLYLLFILIALVSRLYGLGDRVVSHDESLHTQYSYQYYNGEGYQHSPLMHGPTLFHVTAISYWLFGVSDFSSRLPVALLGVLLVSSPYLLRGWLGRKGALFASLLLLISPYVTYYSRYIRHDVYVIMCALTLFIASWYYLQEKRDQYVWWFALGAGLMFATMETSYIYVAIFGSFLIVRLIGRSQPWRWVWTAQAHLTTPAILLGVGLVLGVAGLLMLSAIDSPLLPLTNNMGTARVGQEGAETVAINVTEITWRWVLVGGLLAGAAGLLLGLRNLRPFLGQWPEYDLILLYVTLLLPTMTAFFTYIAGAPPLETSYRSCAVLANETNVLRHAITVVSNQECFLSFITSGFVLNAFFLPLSLATGLALGLWWDARRWLIAAGIFHATFALLYTSFFTNVKFGWVSGMVGSLGYWLVQQNVKRGSQPTFYYLFVTPLYEFLPVVLALLGIGLWLARQGLKRVAGYWLPLLLVTLVGYSFTNWRFAVSTQLAGQPQTTTPVWLGMAAALSLLIALSITVYGVVSWRGRWGTGREITSGEVVWAAFLSVAGLMRLLRLTERFDTLGGDRLTWLDTPGAGVALLILALTLMGWITWRWLEADDRPGPRLQLNSLLGLAPYLIWWVLLTWVIYTIAGEKMPWLSIHFVIPMALLSGWYFQSRLQGVRAAELLSRPTLILTGLGAALWIAIFWVLKMALIDLDWGNTSLGNLETAGLLLGRIITVGLVAALFYTAARGLERRVATRGLWLGGISLLALITLRFTYLSSYVNYDHTNEFLVYAHGAPATKETVMSQIEQLSMRLYGDKSIRVSYDEDVVWPFIWYLRDYPNRHYFAGNPTVDILDSPVLVVGNDNWGKVEPIIQDDYVHTTFSYLQWPMEEYRKLSWDAIVGTTATPEEPRGLGSREVRQALWDIFFYRDYTRYSDIFGGEYRLGQWPLRDELRLYIRRDVFSELWDYGASAVHYEPPPNPYAANQLTLSAQLVIGTPGNGAGQLATPRNIAIGPDGNLYVADSGNHRIQVFGPDGQFLHAFGEAGTGAGQFNEPWGLAVDDQYIYVADTWNYRIQKFTLDGTFVTAFGSGGNVSDGSNDGNLYFGPRAIALLGDDQLVIADTGNHRLQIVDRTGRFISQVGGEGFEPGQLYEPVGLAISPDGFIYVAETWNRRVQTFTSAFSTYLTWPVEAWEGNNTGNKPYLALDNQGRLYITDPEGYRVLIFDREGHYLAQFGRFGQDMSSFNIPNGIALDNENHIYVVDSGNGRILKFAALDFSSLSPITSEDANSALPAGVDDAGAGELQQSEEEGPQGYPGP